MTSIFPLTIIQCMCVGGCGCVHIYFFISEYWQMFCLKKTSCFPSIRSLTVCVNVKKCFLSTIKLLKVTCAVYLLTALPGHLPSEWLVAEAALCLLTSLDQRLTATVEEWVGGVWGHFISPSSLSGEWLCWLWPSSEASLQWGLLCTHRSLICILPLAFSVLWVYLTAVAGPGSKSSVRFFATPRTIQSMEFSRPEYWTG